MNKVQKKEKRLFFDAYYLYKIMKSFNLKITPPVMEFFKLTEPIAFVNFPDDDNKTLMKLLQTPFFSKDFQEA